MSEIASLDYSGGSIVTLSLDDEHAASSYGIGVLVVGPNPDDGEEAQDNAGWVLSGAHFRFIRDQFGDGTGASIFCLAGRREIVCRALGVPIDEPGIEEAEQV